LSSLNPISNTNSISNINPKKLDQVKNISLGRVALGISEWDGTVGGGIVLGQVILLAGEPGVGKSTLLLKLADAFPGRSFYYAGEESLSQISRRARRLGIKLEKTQFVEAGIDVDSLLASVQHKKPALFLVDSIQTLVDTSINSPSGSLAQVRSCAQKITSAVKALSVPAIMVGHINKEGNVAGPKVLEHIVDTTVFLEGGKFQSLRILRVLKNRFGPVDEVGLFEMTEQGLIPALNPSHLFVNTDQTVPGTALAIVMEGTRGLAVEVQALILPCRYGYPKRSAAGISLARLQTLLAVMEKRLGTALSQKDVYVNLAGGLSLKEPALDLPLCMAVLSAFKSKTLPPNTAFFGEVGLGGEIRPVIRQDKRIKQAKKLGFKTISGEDYKSLKDLVLSLKI